MILLYVTMSCINTRSFLLCKRYREYNISVLLQMPFFGLSEVPHEKVVTLFFQPKKKPKRFAVRCEAPKPPFASKHVDNHESQFPTIKALLYHRF